MRFADRCESWNRRLHYYLGLYFLFFLWLFALSGLLINHPAWPVANFWPQRKEVRLERPIIVRQAPSALEQARDVSRQLGIAGEIALDGPRQSTGRLDFSVTRPGHLYQVKTDLSAARARVVAIRVNVWGALFILHHFNGVHPGDEANARDWVMTAVWSLSMDALCIGLIVIIASGTFIWYRSGRRRAAGLIALALGVAVCFFFVGVLPCL